MRERHDIPVGKVPPTTKKSRRQNAQCLKIKNTIRPTLIKLSIIQWMVLNELLNVTHNHMQCYSLLNVVISHHDGMSW